MRKNLPKNKIFVKNILSLLKKSYPKPKVGLNYKNAFELLIATILSAQCTDKRVNIVSKSLFEVFPNPEILANAKISDVENIIISTGFYRMKAKNITNCAKVLVENYNSIVPNKMKELVSLPGVGRKTANCILGTYFKIYEGVVVDTHVKRITNLLKISKSDNPEIIEKDLMEVLPNSQWYFYSNALINHGREVCIARRPKCNICTLKVLCPSAKLVNS